MTDEAIARWCTPPIHSEGYELIVTEYTPKYGHYLTMPVGYRLAADTAHPIPHYVLHFRVVFGHDELRTLVDATRTPHVETTPVRPPPDGYVSSREDTRPRTVGYNPEDAFDEAEADETDQKPRSRSKKKKKASDDSDPGYASAMLAAEAEAALKNWRASTTGVRT